MPYDDLKKKLAAVFDATLGDVKSEGDEIQPSTSPIDLIAGGLGSALGKAAAPKIISAGAKVGEALAADPILGNEIGSIGRNLKPQYFQDKLQTAQEAMQKAPNMFELQRQMQKAGTAERAIEREAKYAALKKQLSK